MDTQKIEKAVRDILEAIGEDPDREGLIETPNRSSFYAATEMSPLVVLLQLADMAASHWLEETFK